MSAIKQLRIMVIAGDFEAALEALEQDRFDVALVNSKDATEKIEALIAEQEKPKKPELPPAKQLTIDV